MGILSKIQAKTGEARAKEKIRPLLESRMMRDILLEIGQRGNEPLDPQSVPLSMRERASQLAAETGLSGLKQSAIDEVCLDAAGITLVCNGESTTFRYADYNYEDIQDTDCLPAVAEYLVQHPLPAHRGEEITDEILEAHAGEIFDEAENRLHVEKAVLGILLAGK